MPCPAMELEHMILLRLYSWSGLSITFLWLSQHRQHVFQASCPQRHLDSKCLDACQPIGWSSSVSQNVVSYLSSYCGQDLGLGNTENFPTIQWVATTALLTKFEPSRAGTFIQTCLYSGIFYQSSTILWSFLYIFQYFFYYCLIFIYNKILFILCYGFCLLCGPGLQQLGNKLWG